MAQLWFAYQSLPRLRISGGGNSLTNDLRIKPGANAVGLNDILSADPKYQAARHGKHQTIHYLKSAYAIGGIITPVPAYTVVDANYSWQFNKQLEFPLPDKTWAISAIRSSAEQAP